MNARFSLLAIALTSFSLAIGYTKKIELLTNPDNQKKIVLFYDCHADERFPVQSQKQAEDIIRLAKTNSAHILIEDIFDYQGTHQAVIAGIERNKYKKPVFLLRDVSDAAKRYNIALENLDYRQDMQYSINGREISAEKAFETVEKIITTIEKFKDRELVPFYNQYLAEFKNLHAQLKQFFDEDLAISQQLKRSEIGKKLLGLAHKVPVMCNIPAHVVMLYDVRLMNLLLLHRIYELQNDKSSANMIFVIAGSYHINDLSNLLQTKLNYSKVADYEPEKHGEEFVDIEKFFASNIPSAKTNITPSITWIDNVTKTLSCIV